MAKYYGNEANITLDGHDVENLRDWSISASTSVTDDSVIGDDWDTHHRVSSSWTASFRVLWDPELDAQEAALASLVGDQVPLVIYVEKQAVRGTPVSGDKRISGNVTVTSVDPGGSRDGNIEATVSMTGSGPLTFDTVT